MYYTPSWMGRPLARDWRLFYICTSNACAFSSLLPAALFIYFHFEFTVLALLAHLLTLFIPSRLEDDLPSIPYHITHTYTTPAFVPIFDFSGELFPWPLQSFTLVPRAAPVDARDGRLLCFDSSSTLPSLVWAQVGIFVDFRIVLLKLLRYIFLSLSLQLLSSSVLSFFVFRQFHPWSSVVLSYVSSFWMSIIFVTLALIVWYKLVRLLAIVHSRIGNIGRKRVLSTFLYFRG